MKWDLSHISGGAASRRVRRCSPGQRWKHREGCRLRERRLWRGSALTPAARAALNTLQAVPGSSGCDCSTSGVTHRIWNYSGLYPIYCTPVLTEKWCQSTQTGLEFAETKERRLLQYHTYPGIHGCPGLKFSPWKIFLGQGCRTFCLLSPDCFTQILSDCACVTSV